MVIISYPDNSGLRVFKDQVFDLSLSIITLIQSVVVNKRAGEEPKVKQTVGAWYLPSCWVQHPACFWTHFSFGNFLQVHTDREALFAEQVEGSGVYRSWFPHGDLLRAAGAASLVLAFWWEAGSAGLLCRPISFACKLTVSVCSRVSWTGYIIKLQSSKYLHLYQFFS